MSAPEITPEEARVRAQQLFRAYLGMMALVHAAQVGWPEVLESLEDAAAEARDRIRIDGEMGPRTKRSLAE